MNTEIATVPTARPPALSANEVREQVQLIQKIMAEVMIDGEHYGEIPGCGKKKALFKPGAEKLCMTFRFRPEYVIKEKNSGEHREYEIVTHLFCIVSGIRIGQGLGCCSSMESKYRFRSESTERPVPKEYWETRDKALLGGKQFHPKKVDGKWAICERIETDNPPDVYNTVLKIAKKRSLVDAILTATAASDIFSQDLDEDIEDAEPPTPGEVVESQQRANFLKKQAETIQGNDYIVEHGSKKGSKISESSNTVWLEKHLEKYDSVLPARAKVIIKERIEALKADYAKRLAEREAKERAEKEAAEKADREAGRGEYDAPAETVAADAAAE